VMFFDKKSNARAMVTLARSGAQDDGQERAEETAATVTGTSDDYATPMVWLGQRSFDGLRKPGFWNRMTHPLYSLRGDGRVRDQLPAAPCHSMSYPSSLVSEHMAASAVNLLLKASSAWDRSCSSNERQ
jgi:hypothetical protein